MPSMVQALLESLGVSLVSEDKTTLEDGLRCLGVLKNTVDFLENLDVKEGMFIWTSGMSWLPFDSVELDEWTVIAKSGKHLIICERESNIVELPMLPDDIDLIYWDRNKFESVLGKAVLCGFLKLSSDSVKQKIQTPFVDDFDVNIDQDQRLEMFPFTDSIGELALKSQIKVDSVLESLGIGGISARPVLLRCKFWQIDGYLNGPNGEEDFKKWLFLEDPFFGNFEQVSDAEYLENVPNFVIIERAFGLDSSSVLEMTPDLCNERRKQNVESDEGKVQISGKLLRWWRIDESRISLDTRTVLIPSWHIYHPLEGNCVIHGRNGSLISSIKELNNN